MRGKRSYQEVVSKKGTCLGEFWEEMREKSESEVAPKGCLSDSNGHRKDQIGKKGSQKGENESKRRKTGTERKQKEENKIDLYYAHCQVRKRVGKREGKRVKPGGTVVTGNNLSVSRC